MTYAHMHSPLPANRLKGAFLVVALLLMAPAAWAQTAQVQFLTPPGSPLNSAFFADLETKYNAFQFAFQFSYTGTTPATFTFRLEIELDDTVILSTLSEPAFYGPGVYTYQTFEMGMGPEGAAPTISFPSADDLIDTALNDRVRDHLINSGLMPEGAYLVSLTPINPDVMDTSIPLDFTIVYPEPPQLLSPDDEAEVAEEIVVFTWLPVDVPAGIMPEYTFRLVERRPGQTVPEAFRSNRPLFESDGLLANTLVYPVIPPLPGIEPLRPGVDYVWGVKAEASHPFSSEGQSEYYTFRYLGSSDIAADSVYIVFDDELALLDSLAAPNRLTAPDTLDETGAWMMEQDLRWADADDGLSGFGAPANRTQGSSFLNTYAAAPAAGRTTRKARDQRATLGPQTKPTRSAQVQGSVSLQGEAFRSSVTDRGRRAPEKAEANANVSFNLFGLWDAQLNLILSTDQSSFRQSSNRAGLDFQIGPVRLSGGDVAPSFSKYSVNGVTIRGGMIQIQPGLFNLSFAGGKSQRSVVNPGFQSIFEPTFNRILYAGRLGYGKQGSSYFLMNGLYGFDEHNPLIPDSLAMEESNYLLAPEFGVNLLQGKIKLENEVGLSLYSRNRFKASEFDLGPIPISTASRISFAGRSKLSLSIKPFKMGVDYERVMPGYESMGLGQIREDQQLIRIKPQVRLFKRKLNVSLNFADRRNNLTRGRLVTTTRQEAGGRFTARMAKWFTLTSGYKRLTSDNPGRASLRTLADSLAPGGRRQLLDTLAVGVNIVVQTITVSPVFTLRQGQMSHNVAFAGNYQVQDNSRLPDNTTTLNGSANYSLTLPGNHGIQLGGTYVSNQAPTAETVVYSVQGGPSLSLWGGGVQVNLSGGWSKNEIDLSAGGRLQHIAARQLTGNLRLSVRLPTGQPLQLTVRGLSNKSLEGMGITFREVTGRISYTHNFR